MNRNTFFISENWQRDNKIFEKIEILEETFSKSIARTSDKRAPTTGTCLRDSLWIVLSRATTDQLAAVELFTLRSFR